MRQQQISSAINSSPYVFKNFAGKQLRHQEKTSSFFADEFFIGKVLCLPSVTAQYARFKMFNFVHIITCVTKSRYGKYNHCWSISTLKFSTYTLKLQVVYFIFEFVILTSEKE